MHYFVYRTTNKKNGKFYVGYHATKNLDDGYLGSGKYLLDAINYHGQEHFSRKILKFFDNEKDGLAYEAQLVTEDLLKNPKTYNLCLGGGKPPSWGSTGLRPDASKRMKENNPVHMPGVLKKLKGNVTVKDKNGNIFSTKKTNPLYINGELVSVNKGRPCKSKGIAMKRVKCPHCNKRGAGGSMKRWHFDNCVSA
jgi:hypothetical protein